MGNHEHEKTNDKQGMSICKICGISLEKEIQDTVECIDKNFALFRKLSTENHIIEKDIKILLDKFKPHCENMKVDPYYERVEYSYDDDLLNKNTEACVKIAREYADTLTKPLELRIKELEEEIKWILDQLIAQEDVSAPSDFLERLHFKLTRKKEK